MKTLSKVLFVLYNLGMIVVVLGLLYFTFNMNKENKNLENEIGQLKSNIELNKSSIQQTQGFVESMTQGFDVNIVEKKIKNTRSGFESGFGSIKKFLVEMNGQVKTLKDNNVLFQVKLERFEKMLGEEDIDGINFEQKISDLEEIVERMNIENGYMKKNLKEANLKIRFLEKGIKQ